MTRILSVASECAPLIKTGGLADVVGALPAALAGHGCDMRVMLPGYPGVLDALGDSEQVAAETDLFGGPGEVRRARVAGLTLYVVRAPHLYERDGTIYLDATGQDWADNPRRFAALSWMATRVSVEGDGDWRADVLHAHDWQAGFAPLYLPPGGPKSIFTIHNIAFPGLAPEWMIEGLRLPRHHFRAEGYEYWGNASALKAGLVFADRITTVSPTYALELQTPEFGLGFDGVIRGRAADLRGILNGIDLDVWNPRTDPAIENYGEPSGKAAARAALLREMGLGGGEGPVVGVVSRLTGQKGLDLLIEALPRLLERDGRLVMLGSGSVELEGAWRDLAGRDPRVAVRIGYDEGLSHRIIAGSDVIAVPSRFEPCGLTQLYGLRYGTIPVVALTGGLADTVVHANPMALRAGVATGVQFAPVTARRLGDALAQVCELFAVPDVWARLQRNAMSQQVGWDASAAEYAALYEDVVGTI